MTKGCWSKQWFMVFIFGILVVQRHPAKSNKIIRKMMGVAKNKAKEKTISKRRLEFQKKGKNQPPTFNFAKKFAQAIQKNKTTQA